MTPRLMTPLLLALYLLTRTNDLPLSVPTNSAASPKVWHFAAEAMNNQGAFSDPSTELVWTNYSHAAMVTLACDPNSITDNVIGYTFLGGRTQSVYTVSNLVMGGPTGTLQIIPIQPTNRVVTVSVLSSTGLAGPWLPDTNFPALTVTNPTGPNSFYRFNISQRTQ
jgi:hypothetical protein